jgi:hypothetical protein
MDAAVNDVGMVVCCDAMGDKLQGRFYCFDLTGTVCFTANLGIYAISADSTLTFFDTYCSETSDSQSLFVVDLAARAILHQFIRPYQVEIDTTNRILALISADGIAFECDFTGRQTNREEYEKTIISKVPYAKR